MRGDGEAQGHIDAELRRAKEVYAEHFKNKSFNFKRFIDLFDRVDKKEEEKQEMKVVDFCDRVA